MAAFMSRQFASSVGCRNPQTLPSLSGVGPSWQFAKQFGSISGELCFFTECRHHCLRLANVTRTYWVLETPGISHFKALICLSGHDFSPPPVPPRPSDGSGNFLPGTCLEAQGQKQALNQPIGLLRHCSLYSSPSMNSSVTDFSWEMLKVESLSTISGERRLQGRQHNAVSTVETRHKYLLNEWTRW